jgi:large subunit ribosomal protein L30
MPDSQKAAAEVAEAQISIKQVRSGIGSKPKARGALRALGLGRIGRAHVLPDRPEIRGMLAGVRHLVEVSPVVPEAGGAGAARAKATPARSSRAKGAGK